MMNGLRGHSFRRYALIVLLIAAACDDFPGSEVIGVRLGPSANTIEVTKILCPGDRVADVRLVLAPEGVPKHDEILWKITSQGGSTQSTFVVGVTPPGFDEDVPLSQDLGLAQGLAVSIDTADDAGALKTFEPQELRADVLLTPDGYLEPDEFEARHRQRCQD